MVYPDLSRSILVNPGLLWSILVFLVYFGLSALSRCFLIYSGLTRSILINPSLSRSYMVNFGLSWSILAYPGLLIWSIQIYLGLSWSIQEGSGLSGLSWCFLIYPLYLSSESLRFSASRGPLGVPPEPPVVVLEIRWGDPRGVPLMPKTEGFRS